MQYGKLWARWPRSSSVRSRCWATTASRSTGRPRRSPTGRHRAGRVLFTGEQIRDGQNVWQSMGGQEVGSGLGPRRVRRPGLVGRLAPPRGRLAARPLGQRRARASPTTSCPPSSRRPCARGCRRSCGPTRYDPATGDADRLRPAGRGDRGRRRALRRAVRADAVRRLDVAARRLRHPGQQRSRTPTAGRRIERLLLLDVLGLRRPTGRAAGRRPSVTYTQNWPPEPLVDNRPDRADARLVGGQLRAAAGRHRRRWRGTSPSSPAREDHGTEAAGRTTRCWRCNPTPVDAGDAQVLLGRRRRCSWCRSAWAW